MQFRILWLVILIAFMALAFAGLRFPSIGSDGIATVSLCLILIAITRLISRRGRERAFWAGFLAAILAQSWPLSGWLDSFVPDHNWTGPVADQFLPPPNSSGAVDMDFRNTLYSMLNGISALCVAFLGGASVWLARGRTPQMAGTETATHSGPIESTATASHG